MRRALKWALIALAVIVALPLLAIAGALVFANTGPGQRLIAQQAGSLSGGLVDIEGFHGGFPGAPRVARIDVRDADGVYLTLYDVALDWSPWEVLSGTAHIKALSAAMVAFPRLPHSAAGQTTSGGGGTFSLPVTVQLDTLHIGRVAIGPAVAGAAMALGIDGHARFRAMDDLDATIAARDLEAGGTYDVTAALQPGKVHAAVAVGEPPHGLAARVASLPDLGALGLNMHLDGPRNAAATTLAVTAGPLRADAHGTLDIDRLAGTLDATVKAPAMAPAPGVSFAGIDLAAHVSGPFAAPDARGHLTLTDLAASGAAVHELVADVSGNRGAVSLRASAVGVRLPGPRPDLIEADPVRLAADLTLTGTRPVTFSVQHPLLSLNGSGRLAAPMEARAHLAVPDVAPFAAIGGVAAAGRTDLDLAATLGTATTVSVDGTLGLTAGPAPAPALIGDAARLGVTASLQGGDVTLSRLQIDGARVRLSASGQYAPRGVTLQAALDLPDLAAAAPTLRGQASLRATAQGPLDNIAATLDLAGDVATAGVPSGHVTARVAASGLPGAPAGRISAEGQLDGAPLVLAADVSRAAGATALRIDKADWRSLHAEGSLDLAPGATLPSGHIALRLARLEDLRRLAGTAISGNVEATLDLADRLATAKVRATNAGIPGSAVGRAALDARVEDPLGAMRVDAALAVDGARAGAIGGRARVSVNGRRDALAIAAQAAATGVAGGAATLQTNATLDLDRRSVALASLQAAARGETLRLLAPARVSFGDQVAVDRLRLGLRDAVLEVAGRASPTLDLTASLRNVRADLARLADPSIAADGLLTADARLTGTTARPSGTVRVAASGLHLRNGPASVLAPASITANAALAGTSARLDASLQQGPNALRVAGTAPIAATGPLDLRAIGNVDLAVLDPILAANGQRVRGRVAVDAGVAGTLAAPRPSGTIRLSGGEVQDVAKGIRVDQIDALIDASGQSVRVAHLTGRAGPGSLSASGTVGLAGAMPVDLRVQATRARPLSGDQLTADLDIDLGLRGALQGRLDLGGKVVVDRAEIRVPDRLPTSVPVLDVRLPGQKPPPPPAPGPDIGLDLLIDSPGQIFVRGRGLDAELEGRLRVRGTAAAPRPEGTFKMRRGSLSVAGKTLTFTTGEVGFDGSGKLDPTLNFVAENTSAGVTAQLAVTGYASAPKITLSSTPSLPQDEVLAHLLFGQSAASLGPFQLAEIAAALAQLTGAGGGGGFDPLNSVRQGLGLDRLSVGGGANGNSPSLEAGRYVARGVYVGAKQGTSGGGTQATVQIDITRGLKLETDVGTGGGSAQGSSGNSSGTSVGVTYQFEY